MSIKDICELSSLLQGEDGSKENYEQELLELEGCIEVQERRFEQEVSNFQDMLGRKNELQIRVKDLVERLDDASTTLNQITFEQNDGEPIKIFTATVSNYITNRDEILDSIVKLQEILDQIQRDCDEVSNQNFTTINEEIRKIKGIHDSHQDLLANSSEKLNFSKEINQNEIEGGKSLDSNVTLMLDKNNLVVINIQDTSKNIEEIQSSIENKSLESAQIISTMREQIRQHSDSSAELSKMKDDTVAGYTELSGKIRYSKNELLQLKDKRNELSTATEFLQSEIDKEIKSQQTKKIEIYKLEESFEDKRLQLVHKNSEIEARQIRITSLEQQVNFYPGGTDVVQQIEELRNKIAIIQNLINTVKSQLEEKIPCEALEQMHQIETNHKKKSEVIEEIASIRLTVGIADNNLVIATDELSKRETEYDLLELELQQNLEEQKSYEDRILTIEKEQLEDEKDIDESLLAAREQWEQAMSQAKGMEVNIEHLTKKSCDLQSLREKKELEIAGLLALQKEDYLKGEKSRRAAAVSARLVATHNEVIKNLKNQLQSEDEKFRADFEQRERQYQQNKEAIREELKRLSEEESSIFLYLTCHNQYESSSADLGTETIVERETCAVNPSTAGATSSIEEFKESKNKELPSPASDNQREVRGSERSSDRSRGSNSNSEQKGRRSADGGKARKSKRK